MNVRFSIGLLLVLIAATSLRAQEIVTITDADIQAGQNVTFTNDKVYLLDGFVFVDSTATLTIQAGTVIKGKPGEGADASALIVARGGKIFANGTKDQPIIFTAEADDVANPTDLTADDRGLWGGLIILGNAGLNVAGGTENIEGIPVTEPRGIYGGALGRAARPLRWHGRRRQFRSTALCVDPSWWFEHRCKQRNQWRYVRWRRSWHLCRSH